MILIFGSMRQRFGGKMMVFYILYNTLSRALDVALFDASCS